jgi:hypothetical protein
MGDWIGLGIIVLVVVGALFGMSQLGKPPKPMSQEEYERRVSESRGFMSAGVMAGLYALQKLLNPKAVEAVEVQRDLKAGFYNDEEKDTGPDEAGRTKKELGPTKEGEGEG